MEEIIIADVGDLFTILVTFILSLTERLQNVADLILHYFGPLATAIAFSMMVSVIFGIGTKMIDKLGSKIVLWLFYIIIMFGLVYPVVTEINDSYNSGGAGALEMSSLVLTLVLMVVVIGLTVGMIWYRTHAALIQVGIFVIVWLLEGLLTAWPLLWLGFVWWLIISLLYIIVVK